MEHIKREINAGTLDPSFGDNGVVDLVSEVSWSIPHSILALSNGKLIYANGDRREWLRTLQLRRVNTNGFFESSFGVNGSVILPIGFNTGARFGLFPYSDDKFLVKSTYIDFGQQDMVFVRLDFNGCIDTTFGSDGFLRIHPYDLIYPRATKPKSEQKINQLTPAVDYIGGSVCALPDGKMLIAHSGIFDGRGFNGFIFRLMPDGSVDKTFNGTGFIIVQLDLADPEDNEAISIALQKDGKFLLCGSFVVGETTSGFIVRYNDNGEVDRSFNNGQPVIIASPDFGMISATTLSVREQDGAIVVVGTAYDNWSVIPTTKTPWMAVLNTNGSFNLVFNNGRPLFAGVVPGKSLWRECAWQEDGNKILVAGSVVARYLSNGQLDLSFNGTGWNSQGDSYGEMVITNDKKLALIGQNSLVRYLT
ncbi:MULTISPECIES: hypothetical protein [unclassified Pseudomonas]|uniref:Delta-60 repeat domain-containing protein n=1 Tax=Pseudomonas sp. MYb327 TaxID=2745230 RepID=A0AAU8E080_9PSED